MIGYGFFIVMLLVMKLAPRSPLGRWLNQVLVERPLTKIAGMGRQHMIMLMILVGLCLSAETVMAFGSFDLLTVYAWDLTVYLDTMVIAYALAAVVQARAAARWLALRVSAMMRRGARPRARRVRGAATRHDRSANDDDPAPAWGLAA